MAFVHRLPLGRNLRSGHSYLSIGRMSSHPLHYGADSTHASTTEGTPEGGPRKTAHRARKENCMKYWNEPKNHTTRRIVLIACSAVLAAAFTAVPQLARAAHIPTPDVPDRIQVPEGNTPFLVGHATGTQNYVCLPCPNPTTRADQCPDDSGFAWLLFT